jgi:hypothetical protein
MSLDVIWGDEEIIGILLINLRFTGMGFGLGGVS